MLNNPAQVRQNVYRNFKSKAMVGLTVAAGVVPVPLRLRICEAPRLPELSVIVSVPFTVPAAAGVNVTLMVQVDPAIRVPAQLLVWANPLPLTETAEIASELPPKLDTVIG